MFKRTLTAVLAAAMLTSGASALTFAADEKGLEVEPASWASIDDGIITVNPGTSASELVACFADRESVSVSDKDANALAATDVLSTGATVNAGDDKITVVVPGDVNADAKIGTRDVISALRFMAGGGDKVAEKAADVNGDGSVNAKDVIKLMRYIVGWDEVISAPGELAASEDDTLTMYFTSTMLRISDGDIKNHGTPNGIVHMAKNEIEDAHFILAATKDKKNLTITVGDIKNADGDVLDREVRYGYYYDTAMYRDLNSRDYGNLVDEKGGWADPYPPLSEPITVKAKTSQSFIVKIKTTAETKAGWYSAPVVVKDSAGNEIKRAKISIYVWDFALDAAPACKSLFEISRFGLANYFEQYTDFADTFEDNWFCYALENKVSLQELPRDITSSAADRWLDDPRVTAFVSYAGKLGAPFNAENLEESAKELRSIYNKLSKKQEWLDKAFIYTVDEPYGWDGAQMVINQWNGAKYALGDTFFKTVVPCGNAWIASMERDLFDILDPYCNAFCPSAGLFTEFATYADQKADPIAHPTWGQYAQVPQYEKYGNLEERYNALRATGEDRWWYICVSPEYPYANFFNTYQGAWARVVFWQQYRYDIDGFLYWDMCFWQMGETDARKISLKRTNGGDGLLLYPGTLWDLGMVAVPSIRMEAVRDGIEDFQYLRQLQRELGYEETRKLYSDRVVTDVVRFSQDYKDIENVRLEMGFALENASH